MRGKRLEARRQRHQALAAVDAAHRCASCKRALPAHPFVFVTHGVQQSTQTRYCTYECYLDARDRGVLDLEGGR